MLITYLGLNKPIEDFKFPLLDPITLMKDSDVEHDIEAVKTYHFTTDYIYQIAVQGQLDDLNPQAKIETPVDYENARKGLFDLHQLLSANIHEDDYAEVYICWSGDEAESNLGEATIILEQLPIPEIYTEPRFLMHFRFDKKLSA